MKSRVIIIIKYLLAIVFIYAGVYKIADVKLFMSQMYQSPLLPAFLVPYLAITVPLFEIVVGMFLIFANRWTSYLLSISFSLMLFFSMYLIMLYTLYVKPPCACGGILSGMTYPQHITFNLIFTLLASLALFLHDKKGKTVDAI
jgi:uncharacterized membrane protein YphA (DoxX/SURF4 family)